VVEIESLPPEIFEPRRRERRVLDDVLDVLVTEVVLDRPRVLALVRELVSAGVPQQVRIRRELKASDGIRRDEE
jgi:hypothetical protein